MKPTIVQGARILILDECPTTNDLLRQEYFSGSNGEELSSMLHDAGLLKSECSLASVSQRPKVNGKVDHLFKKKTPGEWIPDLMLMKDIENLWRLIDVIKPNLIIALGDLSLYALTGLKSVAKWRGSVLVSKPPLSGIPDNPFKIIPTYAPTQIMRMWAWRHIAVQDLKRCARESLYPENKVPDYKFNIRPTYNEANEYLAELEGRLETEHLKISCDIETISRQIACVGYATNKLEAMCIPILTKDNPQGYWNPEQELALVSRQRRILSHENANVFGQNFLYDTQYFIRYWGVQPKIKFDTMVAWHTMFPGEKKSLDFLASMLCGHYVYWKDELTDYKTYPLNEDDFWNYNCKDVVYTYECMENLEALLDSTKQREQFNFQMAMHEPVLQMMLRGVLIDTRYKQQLGMELWDLTVKYQERFNSILEPRAVTTKGKSAWYDSPTQLATLLYKQCLLPLQRDKKTRRPTTGDLALEKLKQAQPLLKPLFQALQEYRSIGVFNKNFVATPLEDNRMHCSFSIAGPETFRFSSSKDAFGYGTNLQNIPSGSKE